MFLRGKKPDGVLKQPKDKEAEVKPAKPKALGGWSDDEAEPSNATKQTENAPTNGGHAQQPTQQFPSSKPAKKDEFRLYTAQQLNVQLNLEYENKLVDEVTQPGGIRIKPNETLLGEFCKAAKTLDVPVIGSLLISRLEMDLSYATKAKALYTMEYVAKKVDKYLAYFRRHMDYILGLPLPGDNEQQYQSLLEDISKSIQGVEKSTKEGGVNVLEFTDPGYNVPQKKESTGTGIFSGIAPKPKSETLNKPPSKTFISPEELKKKKQEETKKTGESVNIMDGVMPSQPAPPKQSEKLDIFSIGDLSGLNLNAPTPATNPTTAQPISVPPPGTFNLYDIKPAQQPQPQQYYQQPVQGMPTGYSPYTAPPYGQLPGMMPMNPGYMSYPGQPFGVVQQPPAGYYAPNKPPVNTPITGANLYASPPTK